MTGTKNMAVNMNFTFWMREHKQADQSRYYMILGSGKCPEVK